MATGLLCDQTISLTGVATKKDYPEKLRRVKYRDAGTGKTFVFLTNNFALPALTIAHLYRSRWQVELFFSGSSNTSESRRFLEYRKTRSRLRFGSLLRFTFL
jgi:Transposase DDE domain